MFSPANVDAAKLWRDDRDQFKKIARKHVNKVTLNIHLPYKYLSLNKWPMQPLIRLLFSFQSLELDEDDDIGFPTTGS